MIRQFTIVGPNGKIPTRATQNSAGYDLYASEPVTIPSKGLQLVRTDVAVQLDTNEYFSIVSRSGLALKSGIFVLNSPGIVDSDYYPNPIGVILYNTSDQDFKVEVGDRIAQGIVMEYKTMPNDESDIKTTRQGGFGSTGVKGE